MAGDNAAAWTAAASAPPGADTLQLLAHADPLGLPPSALVDLIVTAGRLISHVQAMQIAAVAEFARPGRCGDLEKLLAGLTERVGLAHRADGSVDPEKMAVLAEEQARRVATAEIAAALRQSHGGVARRVNEALELVDELPDTLAAVRDGRIDLARAGAIAARTRNLPAPDRQKVEAQVIKLAETRCPGKLNPLIDRRVLKIDADAVNKRCRAARRDRFVDHTAGVDGMGDIRAHLPAEGALTVWDLLDRIARATAGQDERPLGVRRADALTDICTQLLTTGRCDLGADSAPNSETSDEASSTASADTDTGTDTGTDTDADADTEVMVDVPAPFRRERVAGKRLSEGCQVPRPRCAFCAVHDGRCVPGSVRRPG